MGRTIELSKVLKYMGLFLIAICTRLSPLRVRCTWFLDVGNCEHEQKHPSEEATLVVYDHNKPDHNLPMASVNGEKV